MTPDDLCAVLAGDLDQETYDALAHVWPAAHAAVTELLELIDAGELSERTSLLDLPLGCLVAERAA
jgi:hypothetical protein